MNETMTVSWHQALRWRAVAAWPVKVLGITAAICGFMAVYFLLLKHPQYPVTQMPLTGFDRWVGLVPWAVYPYLSLWLYIALVPGLLYLRREMLRYGLAAGIIGLIGCTVFYFWPTAVPYAGGDFSAWPVLAMLKSTDQAGNACPSLHVAFAVLTLMRLHGMLRWIRAPRWVHAGNLLWGALIVWSTMATQQHVALDVMAGAILGAVVALAVPQRWRE